MPTYTTKELEPATGLTTTAASLYVAPASTTTLVKTILLANYTAVDARATIHVVPSAGSVAGANKVFGEVLVTANTTTTIDTAIVIPTGASIHALASANSAINIHISGVEIV